MSAILVLLVLIAVGTCWHRLNMALYHDASSPLGLLFYVWTAPFLLSLSNLSGLQTGIEANAISVIILVTMVLVATCLLPSIHGIRQRPRPLELQEHRVTRVKPAGIVCFYALTLVALYLAEFSGRDLPLWLYLLGDVSDSNLHVAGKDEKLQVIAFGLHAAAIFTFYLWLNEKRRLRRVGYLTLSVAVVAIGLIKTSKSDIFIPLLSYGGLVYYHYHNGRRPSREGRRGAYQGLPRRYKVIALMTLLLVVSVTSLRLEGIGLTGGYAGLIEFRYIDTLGAIGSEVASIVYGYTALGFQNFSNYINTHEVVFRVGTSLFRPALSAVMRGDHADSIGVPVDSWNVVSDAANAGTFLTPLYIEGGVLFCLLGALIYGLLVNFVYIAFRSGRSATWMFAYISLLYPWTWLFFTNAFSVLSIYTNLFYVGVLGWLFVTEKRRGGVLASRHSSSPAHTARTTHPLTDLGEADGPHAR